MPFLYRELPSNLVFKWHFHHLMQVAGAHGRALWWDKAMVQFAQSRDLGDLADRLRNAAKTDASLVAEVIDAACRRFPSLGRREKTSHLEQLVQSGAWLDAALALIDLELPLWQIRRLAYDDGEWYCALSRERELPDWLDQSIETRHGDLSLAILSAFVEAQRTSQPESRPSVPVVRCSAPDLHDPVCCDSFF